MKSSDETYMLEALQIAKKGMSWTFPNPLVGAVIVKNNRIIGRGYHKKAGMPHAETEAFTHMTDDPKGATMYVTLEPCSHFGQTPPCVDEIIKKGIAKIVCAIEDPNPKVHGQGLAKLINAGIQVEKGLLAEKAKVLNEAFFTFYQKRRPFVALKFAASLDGKIATRTGNSKWITNEKMRNFTRNLRAEHQAILVGINTVLVDNPNLGARQIGKKDPLRIILDSTLKIPSDSEVLRDNNILIVTTKRADEKKLEELREKDIEVLHLQTNKIIIPELIKELYKKEIVSIFVEGGAETLGSFADAKIVDSVYACFAPIIVGGRDAVTAIKGEGVAKVLDALRVKEITIKRFDDNFVIAGVV